MRKLTEREIEDRVTEKVVKRIKTIENEYGITLTRRGCHRYYTRRGNELALKRKIKQAESELEDMKKKTK